MLPAVVRPQPQLGALLNHALQSRGIAARNLHWRNLLYTIIQLVDAYLVLALPNALDMNKVDWHFEAQSILLTTPNKGGYTI